MTEGGESMTETTTYGRCGKCRDGLVTQRHHGTDGYRYCGYCGYGEELDCYFLVWASGWGYGYR